MAKRQATRRRNAPETPENLTVKAIVEKLDAAAKRQIDGMREKFSEYGAAFKAAWQKREELCDDFFKLFGVVQSQTSCSFVQYVGIIDPTVPVDQRDDDPQAGTKGYRSHPSYQAALYMQRLQQQRNRAKADKPATRGLNATERLARVLATMVQVIRENEIERFWSGIGEELDLDTAALKRLRNETQSTEPLLTLPHLRPAQRFPARILHMTRPGEEAAEGAEQEAQRNVRGRRTRAA